MINIRHPLYAFALTLGLGLAASQPSAAQEAATLAAAREVVTKMQPDRATLLASMAAPMVPLVQQMGVREADKAQVLVQEVILPTLTANYDKLLDSQARSYASVLSVADLKAVAAFYETPAGRTFVTAQPRLAQAQLASTTAWMQGIAPELQTKLQAAIKAHGWAK